MSVTVTPTSPTSGAFTWQDVLDDAEIKLKNTDNQLWDVSTLLSLLNDAAQLALHAAALLDPDQFASTDTVNLTTTVGHGPYEAPADFKYDLFIEDDQTPPKPLTKISRVDSNHSSGTGRPGSYWLQSRAPGNIYFGLTPGQAYAFTLYYVPVVGRVAIADVANYVPLESFFFEPLVQWLVKFAGQMEEYLTMDEDAKIQQMSGMVSRIMGLRKNPIKLVIKGVGF